MTRIAQWLRWQRLRAAALYLLEARQATLVVLIAGVALYLSLATDSFLTIANLKAVALGLAIDTILVVGMTYVIVAGGFDLSVGSTLALTAVTTALVVQDGVPWAAAAIVGVTTGVIAGAVNGILTAFLEVNALIATLGTLFVFEGIALIVTSGSTIDAGNNPIVNVLGQGDVGGVPVPVLFAGGGVVAGALLLRYSRQARYIFFVGGNPLAARLAGLPVRATMFASYVLMGALAGVAGILSLGRVGNASATLGSDRELGAITAVILGGASLKGGEGTVVGSTLAVIFLAFINNALILLDIPVFWQEFTVGTVLIVAVVFNIWKVKLRDRAAVRRALYRELAPAAGDSGQAAALLETLEGKGELV